MNCIHSFHSTHEKAPTQDIESGEIVVPKKPSWVVFYAQLSLYFFAVVSVIIFVSLYDEEPESLNYLKARSSKNESVITYIPIDSIPIDGMSARIMGHHRHHWLKCSDFDYGCCEIVYAVGGHNYSISINPYRIVKHDREGTNCPTIESMIQDYNSIYTDDSCVESEEGCCKLHSHQLNLPRSTSCPNERGLVYMYESRYYDPTYDNLLLLLCISVIFCVCVLTRK